jgi:hypothetical protein
MMGNSSSPHEARNYQGIVNSVRIYLCAPATSSQAAILVEGPDDAKIYRKFLDQNMTRIFACKGKNDLQRALSELSTKTDDVFNLCNGHDVTALLVKIFNINAKKLAEALRLSFHREQFIKTVLYRELLAWQTEHGIVILYSFFEEAANG